MSPSKKPERYSALVASCIGLLGTFIAIRIAATAIASGWPPPLAAWHAIKVSIGLGIASAIIWAAVARAFSHKER